MIVALIILTLKLVGAFALTYAFQQVYASHDWLAIFRNLQLRKKTNLNHTSRHLIRISYVTLLACVAFSGWVILPAAWALASFFFLGFDPSLNRYRGKQRFYMGPSNAHDKFFLWLRDTRLFKKLIRRTPADAYFMGRLLYRCELALLVLGVAVFYLTAFSTLT